MLTSTPGLWDGNAKPRSCWSQKRNYAAWLPNRDKRFSSLSTNASASVSGKRVECRQSAEKITYPRPLYTIS